MLKVTEPSPPVLFSGLDGFLSAHYVQVCPSNNDSSLRESLILLLCANVSISQHLRELLEHYNNFLPNSLFSSVIFLM